MDNSDSAGISSPMPLQRCKVCGKAFAGRTDKRFCSERCKNIFNNSRYSNERKVLRSFNSALAVNYFLLKQVALEGHTECLKSVLLRKGFKPNCFSSERLFFFRRWYRCFDLYYRVGPKFVHLKAQ
jgi:predicted nucleic acid-binding Zn ribbon protein